MDDILNQIIGYIYVFLFFFQTICGGVGSIAVVAIVVLYIIDLKTFRSFDGDIRRGIKISSKSLSDQQKQYLENLSGDVVEYGETLFGKDMSAFIRKQNGEVLIYAKQSYGFRWRRSWPLVGYINLATFNPVLEFRSSLPFVLFLISLALSIFLLPFIIVIGVIGFSMEIQTIEKFLQNKVESTASQKAS